MKILSDLRYLALIGLLTLVPLLAASAKEELTVIQTVSKDRKSFVVAKGIKDGVLKGQEIIFANDNVSIVCKASEVSRDFSLWVPVDRLITIPFNKEEIVSSNSTVYGNVALELVGDTGLVPEYDYNKMYKKFRAENNFTAKASYNRGLAQSSSEVAQDKSTSRAGFSVSAEYNYRFLPEFEMSFGGRFDNEVYHIEDPELDIPTSRMMATVAATFHFVNFTSDKNNFYFTLAAGIGKSKTVTDEIESSGHVILLPEARLGYLMPLTKGMAMVLEASVEAMSATENFPATSGYVEEEYYETEAEEQTTNSTTLKVTFGLRF